MYLSWIKPSVQPATFSPAVPVSRIDPDASMVGELKSKPTQGPASGVTDGGTPGNTMLPRIGSTTARRSLPAATVSVVFSLPMIAIAASREPTNFTGAIRVTGKGLKITLSAVESNG